MLVREFREGVRTLALASVLVIASTSAYAQPAPQPPQTAPDPQLTAALALPISPGSIALLVEHGDDAAAQQRVREALKDARPAVRIVAARVIYGAGLRMLLADLRAAVKVETDPLVAAQEVRALMTFSPPLATECVAAATRLGGMVATEVVDTFARLNSGDLMVHLSALEEAHASPASVRSALNVLIDSDPSLRDRLLRERTSDPIAIEAAMTSFRKTKTQPPDDLLIAALNSDTESVRTATDWLLARGIASDALKLTPAVAAAVDARLTASGDAITWESLGLDLIERASNRARHERRWSELAQRENKSPWSHDEDRVLFSPLLSKVESIDLAAVLHINPESLTTAVSPAELTVYKTPRAQDYIIRTTPRIAEGFEGELLKLTGCDTKALRMVSADVAYRPDGRPRKIVLVQDDSVPDGCRWAGRVVFSLTVPKVAKPLSDAYTEAIVLPLDPDQVACADAPVPIPAGSTGEGMRLTKQVTAPKRIKMVNPQYPPSAQKDRREGVVIIESTISPGGCVIGGSVLSSPDTRLSAAALYAVMQWHYTPTLLDGKPVPVIMTVTVNFFLH